MAAEPFMHLCVLQGLLLVCMAFYQVVYKAVKLFMYSHCVISSVMSAHVPPLTGDTSCAESYHLLGLSCPLGRVIRAEESGKLYLVHGACVKMSFFLH